jgi:hypothetical protein
MRNLLILTIDYSDEYYHDQSQKKGPTIRILNIGVDFARTIKDDRHLIRCLNNKNFFTLLVVLHLLLLNLLENGF